jgi:hypothetical protein
MTRGKVDAEATALDVLDRVATPVNFDVAAASLMDDRHRRLAHINKSSDRGAPLGTPSFVAGIAAKPVRFVQ